MFAALLYKARLGHCQFQFQFGSALFCSVLFWPRCSLPNEIRRVPCSHSQYSFILWTNEHWIACGSLMYDMWLNEFILMDDGISIVSGNCSIRKYTYFRFERDFTKSHSQFTMLNHTTRKLLNVLFFCAFGRISLI